MAIYHKMFFNGSQNKDKSMRFLVKARTVAPISFDFRMFEVNDEAELHQSVIDALISQLSTVGIEIEGEVVEGEDKLEKSDIRLTEVK